MYQGMPFYFLPELFSIFPIKMFWHLPFLIIMSSFCFWKIFLVFRTSNHVCGLTSSIYNAVIRSTCFLFVIGE